MSYLDESGLSTYDSNLKEWVSSQESKTITSSIYPWTKTAKAGAVSYYPVGGTELKPVVDFLFTEVPPASGDKGPENPSTITGVSTVNVARCGKNLVQYPYVNQSKTVSDVAFTVNDNGTVSANGVASDDIVFVLYRNIALKKDVSYRLSGCSGGSNLTYSLRIDLRKIYSGGGYFNTIVDIGSGATYTPSVDCWGAIYIDIRSGVSLTNQIFQPQLELGSSATTFEPYAGADYTVNLGGTYYGGSVDFATGLMTVTKIEVTMTKPNASDGINQYGGATFRIWPANFLEHPGVDVLNDGEAICDKLPYSITANALNRFYVGDLNVGAGAHPVTIILDKDFLDFSNAVDPSNPTTAEVRNAGIVYFATNPLHFVFTVVEPFTVQLSPVSLLSLAQTDKYTPRLNTIYTDASAVQVGYVKSPIREEYELTQAIMA